MTLAILHKSGKLDIFGNIYAVNMEDGRITYRASMDGKYCYAVPLYEVSKVSVDGIVYYKHGRARI